MNAQEYIASGILELYVAGVLSEKENEEVHAAMEAYPEVRKEVEEIEKAIVELTASTAPKREATFQNIRQSITPSSEGPPVITLDNRRFNWFTFSGWAAAIIVASALIYTLIENDKLQQQLDTTITQQDQLEEQISKAKTDLAAAEKLNEILRSKDILSIPLTGQQVSPQSYAKVYWDKNAAQVYVDVQGLPEPPAGKVYQVWSLKLDPLTPTSLGILDNYNEDKNKVFALENPNASEAFGITLEPEGGSETPTLEQLYTLGTVTAAP